MRITLCNDRPSGGRVRQIGPIPGRFREPRSGPPWIASTSVPVMPESTGTDDAGVDARPPRTYLGWAVASTALCFLPLGLIAIIYGLRTNSALAAGRVDDARRSSRNARRWVVGTIVVGLLVDLLLVASMLLLGAFST